MTDSAGLQIGRGIADITGEPWGAGMMGYGMPRQWSKGILSRQFARAFVFDDGSERIVYVVADLGMFFQSTVEAVLAALSTRFNDQYTARNVVLTATHTHCGPGGHGHHVLYNITTRGFHRRTFERVVEGVVEAISRAHDDVVPSTAILNRGALTDASANRSEAAFELNPESDRAAFPDSIDPLTTLLRIERDGSLVGAINWFAVHGTSMTNRNQLISADNKGVAAQLWEDQADAPRTSRAALVTAFAQTNAGDLSPNLDLRPGTGPTDSERDNTRIIGSRQSEAAQSLARQPGEELAPILDVRMTYANLSQRYTADGATGRAVLGASFAAGKLTDGAGSPLFDEGKNNPVPERISAWLYRAFPAVAAHHAPKDLTIPVGPMKWIAETYPIQLIRIGSLYLLCLPFEVTVVAGLRLRRAIADILAVELDHVLVQGYANGYAHYVTTPQEYDFQAYEGGSTVFGRHELAALTDIAGTLATAMRSGRAVAPGEAPAAQRFRLASPSGSPRLERRRPIAVLAAPTHACTGEVVTVTFAADHPNGPIRPNYLLVERETPDGWISVADDNSLATSIEWDRDRRLRWRATVTWQATVAGTYRISYLGRTRATTDPIKVLD